MINFLSVFYFWALENGTYALISFASASSSISSSSAVSRVDISLRTFCSSAKSRPLTKWVCSMSPPKNLDSCYRKKKFILLILFKGFATRIDFTEGFKLSWKQVCLVTKKCFFWKIQRKRQNEEFRTLDGHLLTLPTKTQ